MLPTILLPLAMITAAPAPHWRPTSDPAQICLMQGERPLGNFHLAGPRAGLYFKYLGGHRWESLPSDPPASVPEEHRGLLTKRTEPINYGVDADKLEPGPKYKHNGQEISREEALRILGDKQLPDDKSLLRVTVIGDEARRKQVLDDLKTSPALAAWKDKIVVKAYDPVHWAVKDSGFVTRGDPVVYVQDPSGKVLHRQVDYADGADGLALALRKADPNYKPDQDPDRRKDPPPFPLPYGLTWPTLLLGALGLFLLLKKDGK